MDPNAKRPDDALNDLESRLTAWQPACADLSLDRMLFLAGQASGRPGPSRFLWPIAVSCLSVATLILGQWALVERAERMAIARQLHPQGTPHQPVPPPTIDTGEPANSEESPARSLLAKHRNLEQGLDEVVVPPPIVPGPSTPAPPVLRAWQPQGIPDL